MEDAALPPWATPVVVGVSHRTAPVELRERLAFDPEEIAVALGRLIGSEGVSEALILSTCNRVEVSAIGAARIEREPVGPVGDLTRCWTDP